ncbi:MAG: iron donor protein CyaY [Myxococcota bacterium]|jgi:CyaY protein|nr:iron donor protein CyaY [Myxococcota bacterium]MEC9389191.1 iron donor protein CyaY [Myxococcota bacterium]
MTRPNDFNDEGEFRRVVKGLLVDLLDQVDDIESDDHDPSLTDGNLKVVFEDGSTFVLSQQPPTRELWLSANFTAWHFVRSGGAWTERDSGDLLTDVLSSLFSEKLGMAIRFSL